MIMIKEFENSYDLKFATMIHDITSHYYYWKVVEGISPGIFLVNGLLVTFYDEAR